MGFHLNQANSLLHKIDIGESLWAFTRKSDGRYVLAAELVVSAHTVQQHLKSIFDKTGVHSRRDLIGKIFFTHYEPRFRDNEARARHHQPLRGGPWPH